MNGVLKMKIDYKELIFKISLRMDTIEEASLEYDLLNEEYLLLEQVRSDIYKLIKKSGETK